MNDFERYYHNLDYEDSHALPCRYQPTSQENVMIRFIIVIALLAALAASIGDNWMFQ